MSLFLIILISYVSLSLLTLFLGILTDGVVLKENEKKDKAEAEKESQFRKNVTEFCIFLDPFFKSVWERNGLFLFMIFFLIYFVVIFVVSILYLSISALFVPNWTIDRLSDLMKYFKEIFDKWWI